MKQTPWTQEETDRLLALILTMEWRDAARELGRSFGSVQGRITWLRGQGVAVQSRPWRCNEKRLSEEQIVWIREHLETTSRVEMAAHLGIAYDTLFHKLKALGLSSLLQRRWTDQEDEELRTLAGHHSARDIATRFGCSRYAVLRRALQLGLSLRTRLPITQKPGTVAREKPRERQGISRAPRIVYSGRVAWCEQCCAPVVDSPKGWAEHNARVHVASRRVA